MHHYCRVLVQFGRTTAREVAMNLLWAVPSKFGGRWIESEDLAEQDENTPKEAFYFGFEYY